MREKEDERNLQISLTENGKKIKPVLESISEQVFEDFNFSKEEETELVHSLRHVITNNFANASE